MDAIEYTDLQYQLGQLKTEFNEIMQQIRECNSADKEFKYLANKKQNISKRIESLSNKIRKGLQDNS